MAAQAAGKPAGGAMGGIAILAGLILISAVAGAGFTVYVMPKPAAQKSDGDKAADDAPPKSAKASAPSVKEFILAIEPMVVSMAGPEKKWVRLEGAVSFTVQPSVEEQALLLRQISEDLMGYLRSTQVSQLGSATSFEFLREELTDLVRIRTKSRARRFILKSLVVE